jgi:hypothetical protein
MVDHTLSRRDLHRLAFAALGGLVAGTLAGCGGNPAPEKKAATADKTDKAETKKDKEVAADDATPRLLQDPHVCRGINTCKNKGKKGTTNDCAGRAHCATVVAHDCNGMNDCKGMGGCGEHPGENGCKGKGGCEVPLSDKTWPKARKRFEELMTQAGKKFGDAPPKNG